MGGGRDLFSDLGRFPVQWIMNERTLGNPQKCNDNGKSSNRQKGGSSVTAEQRTDEQQMGQHGSKKGDTGRRILEGKERSQ